MPSILKRFMNPEANPYQFLEAEDLDVGAIEIEAEQTPDEIEIEPVQEPQRATAPQPASVSQIDYAKIQAQAIIDDAHEQARQLIQDAQAQIEAQREEAWEQGQQEGYSAGYGAGLSSAAEEAKQQRTQQAVMLAGEVQRFLDQCARAHEDLLVQTQGELRDLAIAVAEKVVKVSIKSSGEIISRMLQSATEKLKRKEWVHIYVAGCHAKELTRMNPSLAAALAALSDHVKIVPMADDEAGTCIIETPDEIIDASASTQLSNIRDLLSEG